MKARFFVALILLTLLVQQSANADVRYSFATRDLIRLQVRAASDLDEDQAVKLTVRDAVRDAAVPMVRDAETPEQAFALLAEHRAEIERVAKMTARGAGYLGSVRAEVDTIEFPLRIYGEVAVPPGEYRALRVTLGDGSGRNWWCVVYPDLCATDAASAEALREGQPIQFYSSIMKWIHQWFGGSEFA